MNLPMVPSGKGLSVAPALNDLSPNLDSRIRKIRRGSPSMVVHKAQASCLLNPVFQKYLPNMFIPVLLLLLPYRVQYGRNLLNIHGTSVTSGDVSPRETPASLNLIMKMPAM